jgi:hypothetical protein
MSMQHLLTIISCGLMTEKCLIALHVFLKECYLNSPDDMIDNNPLDMENIKEQQYADDALLQHATKYADQRRGVEDGHVRQQHNKR